jgi:hypothetical protein
MLPVGGAITAALGVFTAISSSTFSVEWWVGVIMVIVGAVCVLPALATVSFVTFSSLLVILVTSGIVFLAGYYFSAFDWS